MGLSMAAEAAVDLAGRAAVQAFAAPGQPIYHGLRGAGAGDELAATVGGAAAGAVSAGALALGAHALDERNRQPPGAPKP